MAYALAWTRTRGHVEKRIFRHPNHRRRDEDLLAKRFRVLEVRNPCDREALTLPPVAASDIRLWRAEIDESAGVPPLEDSQPLIGIDHEIAVAADRRQGLGIQESLLTPTPSLIALLSLRPGSDFVLEDDVGPGLALVIWRAEYDTSEYHLPWPRIRGSGIVMRPDLFDRLITAAEGRLVVRDFVVADSELGTSTSERLERHP